MTDDFDSGSPILASLAIAYILVDLEVGPAINAAIERENRK